MATKDEQPKAPGPLQKAKEDLDSDDDRGDHYYWICRDCDVKIKEYDCHRGSKCEPLCKSCANKRHEAYIKESIEAYRGVSAKDCTHDRYHHKRKSADGDDTDVTEAWCLNPACEKRLAVQFNCISATWYHIYDRVWADKHVYVENGAQATYY